MRKRPVPFALCLSLLAALFAGGCDLEPPVDCQQALAAGDAAWKEFDGEGAAKYYAMAVKADPLNAGANWKLAQAYDRFRTPGRAECARADGLALRYCRRALDVAEDQGMKDSISRKLEILEQLVNGKLEMPECAWAEISKNVRDKSGWDSIKVLAAAGRATPVFYSEICKLDPAAADKNLQNAGRGMLVCRKILKDNDGKTFRAQLVLRNNKEFYTVWLTANDRPAGFWRLESIQKTPEGKI